MKKMILAAALFAATLCLNNQAQAYSTNPSWMPMTMLNVSFDTTTGVLDVVNQSAPVLLAIDTLANGKPNAAATAFGSFAAPESVLNNTAFSRQLGWNPTNYGAGQLTLQQRIESYYGPAASIWIDLKSKSQGLDTYVAVGSNGLGTSAMYPLSPYAGIFGTAGSDTKWHWDYMMDHNANTVSLANLVANQLYTATYEIYVGDSAGNKIGASTIETWTWQAPATVPTPIPAAAWLLGSGLMGLVGLRRKNRV